MCTSCGITDVKLYALTACEEPSRRRCATTADVSHKTVGDDVDSAQKARCSSVEECASTERTAGTGGIEVG